MIGGMTTPVTIITGGTRGIGLGIAGCLAREGHALALCGVRDAAECEPQIKPLCEAGAEVAYFQCDVSQTAARASMLDAVRRRFGRLNFLVNNAGVAPNVRADLLDAGEESFERVMRINLQGPYFLTQAVARWLVEQKKADRTLRAGIVNVSSISATVASVNRGEYCISKAGVAMMTQLWAVRLAEFDIPVYEVRPGIIQTDMTAAVQAKYDKLIEEGLLLQKRWGKPDDIGKAVAALTRGDLPYSTGQIVMVDGGMTVARL
jgi:3-oxoacyl-[acyl-carrier protein] reductase